MMEIKKDKKSSEAEKLRGIIEQRKIQNPKEIQTRLEIIIQKELRKEVITKNGNSRYKNKEEMEEK